VVWIFASLLELLRKDDSAENKMKGCEDKLFKDIKLQGKPLSECELVYKGKHDNSRLYVVKDKDGNSFCAHAVEFNACPSVKDESSHWDNDGLIVNTLFDVTAYYDGVRHLQFNRNGGDMDGYLYCPICIDADE